MIIIDNKIKGIWKDYKYCLLKNQYLMALNK